MSPPSRIVQSRILSGSARFEEARELKLFCVCVFIVFLCLKIYRFLRRKKTGRFVLTSGFSFFLKKYAQPSAVRTFPFYRNKSKSQRRKTVRLNSLFFSKSKKFVPSQGFFCAEKFYCGAIFACAKKMRVKNSGNENYKNIICIGCFGGVRVRGVRPCAARLENKKCGHGQGNSRNGRAARKL